MSQIEYNESLLNERLHILDMTGLDVEFFTSEDAWLKNRLTGIGGTGASIIDGGSSYKTEKDLYNELKGTSNYDACCDIITPETTQQEINSSMYRLLGKNNEEFVARMYADKTGNKIVSYKDINPKLVNWSFRHKQFDMLIASFDYIVLDQEGRLGILEVKTSWGGSFRNWNFKDKSINGVSKEYRAQPIHYVGMSPAFQFADIALLAPLAQEKFSIFHWERDDMEIERLQSKEIEWWNKFMLNDEHSEVINDVINIPDDVVGKNYVEGNLKIAKKVERLDEVRKLQKELKSEEDALKEQILSEFNSSGFVVYNYKPILEIRESSRDTVDHKSLLASLSVEPDVVKKFTKTTKFNTLVPLI